MNVTHILLKRPCMFDQEVHNDGEANTELMLKGQFILQLPKQEATPN